MTGTILITGASDGIGLELARLHAEEGWTVIGTGSRPETALPDGWPPGATYIRSDLSNPDCAESLVTQLAGQGWSKIDVAILNAGYGSVVDPIQETADNLFRTIDVNLTSTIVLANQFYPLLCNAVSRSCLVLIGSVAHKGTANFASYAASKAGVHGLGRALHEEWKGVIDVVTIHPGPTATTMHAKAGLKESFANRLFLDPAYMAKKIRQKIQRRKPFSTISFGARAIDKVLSPLGLGP